MIISLSCNLMVVKCKIKLVGAVCRFTAWPNTKSVHCSSIFLRIMKFTEEKRRVNAFGVF